MNNIRKIVIHCQTNTMGTDSWNFVEIAEDITEEELNDLAWEYALGNAETYGIYPPSDSDTEEEFENADDSICGCWYEYVPEKHDMYTNSGTPAWDKY